MTSRSRASKRPNNVVQHPKDQGTRASLIFDGAVASVFAVSTCVRYCAFPTKKKSREFSNTIRQSIRPQHLLRRVSVSPGTFSLPYTCILVEVVDVKKLISNNVRTQIWTYAGKCKWKENARALSIDILPWAAADGALVFSISAPHPASNRHEDKS